MESLMSGGRVFGFNSPDAVAYHEDTLYLPAANGVIVRHATGQSQYWKPTGETYKVDKITVSGGGVLCLSEKRLEVSLHFYRVPACTKLGELKQVTSVSVEDMTFSSSGDLLYVLCTIPTSSVKVFTAQGSGAFVQKEVVPLEPLGFSRVVASSSRTASFYVWSSHTVSYFVSGAAGTSGKNGAYGECMHLHSSTFQVSTVASVDDGVLLGSHDGRLAFHAFDQADDEVAPFGTVAISGAAITWLGPRPAAGITEEESTRPIACTVADSAGYLYSCQLELPGRQYHQPSESVPVCRARPLGQVGSPIARVVSSSRAGAAAASYIVSAKRGVFSVDVPTTEPSDDADSGMTAELLCARSGATVRCIPLKNDRVVIVAHNGDVTVSSAGSAETGHCIETVTRYRISTRTYVVDATLLFDRFLIVLVSEESAVHCFDLVEERELATFALPHFTPTHCCAMDSNGLGRLLLSDESSTHFVTARVASGASPASGGGIQFESFGYTEAALSSPLSLLYWLPTHDGRFLATCENGEVYLLRYPDGGDATTVHPPESLTENMWRLDFPVVEMFACFVHPDVVNLLVHSVDKDTKLYTLDRKRETDGKVLRPLFMMRDHENGGTVLRRYDSTTVLSTGHDGRVILRDVGHYQSKLSPIPPSKEKRKPAWEVRARHAYDGGITTACLVPALRVFVCGSESDAVVTVMTSDVAADADGSEPLVWHEEATPVPHAAVTTVATAAQPGAIGATGASARCDDEAAAAGGPTATIKSELASTMQKLREQWRTAMKEKDDDVPVHALLVPSKQEEFAAECDAAIFDMREQEYYNTLMNEYLQDMLRKRCCDSMDVGRLKVGSVARAGLEVHNFQILKATRASEKLAHKFQFLRRVQKRVGRGRTFSAAETTVASPSAKQEVTQEDELLWRPTDIYTICRAVVQLFVLKGLILSEKDDFNRRFNALRERKRSVVSLIQERTSRCVQIRKQLGLHQAAAAATTAEDTDEKPLPELFVVHVDREEDPNSLFQVYDDELDEEAQALIVKDTGARVLSPSNEAAIKLWMDGLEKEVEVLQVHLKPPEFADETCGDGFVPPDERTNEQARQMEDYERLLKEETEAVNTKREALRNEFRSLQAQNRDAAASLDEAIKGLRTARLSASEHVCHCELQQVEMARRCFLPFSLAQMHGDLGKEKADLERRLKTQSVLLESSRETANGVLNELEALEEEDATYANSVRGEAPFNDSHQGDKLFRRFARWKNKFDEAKAERLRRDARPDEFSEALWEQLCEHCDAVAEAREAIHALEDVHKTHVEAFEKLEAECQRLRDLMEQCDRDIKKLADSLIRAFLNTRSLYQLQQGQVQDEKAVLASDFATSHVRRVDDVLQYNELILASDAESTRLLEKIVQRQRGIKAAKWETERLRYGVGTLQVELRQLHTLRVTRQMQEWLAGDADISEDKTIARIDEHMRYVEESMDRKADGLKAVMKQLKRRIGERATENDIIDGQMQQLRSTVHDQSTVKSMVDAHADGSYQHNQRAKEIYQTSELEELARTQQEELLRLKREVDRLRERTFPSFAVVSKRTT